MAISRPFLLALVGAVLLGATLFAVQNARNSASDDAAPAAQESQPSEAAPAEPVQASNPEDSIKSSLNGTLKSARFSSNLSISGLGQTGSVAVSGAFETPAQGEVPQFEVFIKADGAGTDVDVGLVSTGDQGYITQGDKAYRVPQSAWNQVIQAASKAETPADQVTLPFSVNPTNWLRDVKEEDDETIDGVETSHVSASVDVETMVNDVFAAAQQTGAQTAQLPENLQQQAADAVKKANFDVYVGKDDGLLRRAQADVEITPANSEPVELSADVNLSQVNQPQDIKAPKNVLPGAPSGQAGALAQGFLGAVGATEAAEATSLAALATNNPQKAARAIRQGKKVVIFFLNPRGLDDRLVLKSVRTVDRKTKAVVLTDPVDAIERYGRLVQDLGVSQAPSIVLIDRSGNARLIEGYVDTESLTQAVADAR